MLLNRLVLFVNIITIIIATETDNNNLNNTDPISIEFKDAGEHKTPWWRLRPYPLRQSNVRGCQCEADYACACCAGIELQRLNISQKACLNMKYDPDEFSMEIAMKMNERELLKRQVSGRNPSPLCLPMPSPLGFLPPIGFCARLFNIFTPGRNLHWCLDFQTKISESPVLIFEFDCIRVGADGFSFLKPEDGGGLPDITSGGVGGSPIEGGGVGIGGGGGGGGGGSPVAGGGGSDEYDELEPDTPDKKKPSKNKNKPKIGENLDFEDSSEKTISTTIN